MLIIGPNTSTLLLLCSGDPIKRAQPGKYIKILKLNNLHNEKMSS